MFIKKPTVARQWGHNMEPRDASLFTLHASRTSFMQNEPNFQKTKMYLNPYNTKHYVNNAISVLRKNEPKTNPIKPNPEAVISAPPPLRRNTQYAIRNTNVEASDHPGTPGFELFP